jgi:hypothetical protein
MTITRKMTGKVVGMDVLVEQLTLILGSMPTGVYSVDDAAGNECAEAKVRSGNVRVTGNVAAAY